MVRIGGLASGMDIDQLVSDLMKAERIPLDKMEQKKQLLEWQRDDYREMNKLLFDLDQMAVDMKLSSAYKTKSTSSSNSAVVTASASSGSSDGAYNITVKSLATAAVNVSTGGISDMSDGKKIDPDAMLNTQVFAGGNDFSDFTIVTYDAEGSHTHTFQIDPATQSLNDVLRDINESELGIRAFYDANSDKVVLERTETGDFNTGTSTTEFMGAEIGYNGTSASFLANTLQIKAGRQLPDGTWERREEGGTNAEFTYNGVLDSTSSSNSYTVNGVTFNFHNTSAYTLAVDGVTKIYAKETITVNNDVDAAYDKIKAFIDKYNEVIEKINGELSEDRYRDYQPLTSSQKEDMEDREVELWEERAKSGMLRNDSILRSGLNDMRMNLYATVATGESYTHLNDIGIETSSNYMDKGKLVITESELKEALQNDPDAVYKLFVGDDSGAGKGLIKRLSDAIDETMDKIENKAGNSGQVNTQFLLGKDLNNLDDRMDAFQDRLTQIEDRYWRQFTAMEQAIQRSNQQSMFLMNNFGGGM